MFLFERLKNPNNKTPNIKKKKQKSYWWEMVWICHPIAAAVCTWLQAGTHRLNVTWGTANSRIRNKGHKIPMTPHLSLASNEKHRQNSKCFSLIPSAIELGRMTVLCHPCLGSWRFGFTSQLSCCRELSAVGDALRQGLAVGKRTTTHLVSIKRRLILKSPTRIMASSVFHSYRYRNIEYSMYITVLIDSTRKTVTSLSWKSGNKQHCHVKSHLEKGWVQNSLCKRICNHCFV